MFGANIIMKKVRLVTAIVYSVSVEDRKNSCSRYRTVQVTKDKRKKSNMVNGYLGGEIYCQVKVASRSPSKKLGHASLVKYAISLPWERMGHSFAS